MDTQKITSISLDEFQARATRARQALALACELPLDTSASVCLNHAFERAGLYNRTTPGTEINDFDRALETFSRTTLNLMMNYAKQHLPEGFDMVPAV